MRFVARFEWLTLCPKCGPLPQISQLPDIIISPFIWVVLRNGSTLTAISYHKMLI